MSILALPFHSYSRRAAESSVYPSFSVLAVFYLGGWNLSVYSTS